MRKEPLAKWMTLVEAVRFARRRFGAAVARLAGVEEAGLTDVATVRVLERLAAKGEVGVAARSLVGGRLGDREVHTIGRGDPLRGSIVWMQAAQIHGMVMQQDGPAALVLDGPDLVLALAAAMPPVPDVAAIVVPGVEFLADGRAVADLAAALRLVERHKLAWWWITSPVRNANFSERHFPPTAAAVLAALFDPSEPGFARLFGRLADGWSELDWSARPVIADDTGLPVGIVTVRDSARNAIVTVPVGFAVVPLAHKLEALAAEAERRARRMRGPDPEEAARLAAQREAQARAEAAEVAKRREAEAVFAALDERQGREREAQERARIAALIPAAPEPVPEPAPELAATARG